MANDALPLTQMVLSEINKNSISFLDYQRLYRDNEMMSSSFNSAYQWSSNDNEYDNAAPFQRGNNAYWTLQTRSKGGNQRQEDNNSCQTRDDLMQARPTTQAQDIESLYSTPHKNRVNKLKTTPLGFELYSPVAPLHLNERIVEEEDETDSKDIMSPIDPRNNGVFSTSTPQKNPNFSTMSPAKASLTEDLRSRLRMQNPGIRSHGNSPISSGRSTPKCVFEPQHQTGSRHSWSSNNVEVPSSTCSDRLGTPKTSLMDFKKLLLNKNTSARSGKLSAVELLKMSKSNVQPAAPSPTPSSLNSSMNILDLSGSPKTFATRRMIRQGQFGPNLSNSPSKSSSKQKHAWRMANMRTDVISTAIPEAANDEEQESASNTNQQQRMPIEIKKSPEIVIKDVTEVEAEVEHKKASEAIQVLNLKENLFIKQQENNFTEHEIREHKKSALHNLQQQRAQFLFGVTAPSSNLLHPTTINNNNNKTAVFKSGGHYTGIVTTTPPNKDAALNANNNLPASLETAL